MNRSCLAGLLGCCALAACQSMHTLTLLLRSDVVLPGAKYSLGVPLDSHHNLSSVHCLRYGLLKVHQPLRAKPTCAAAISALLYTFSCQAKTWVTLNLSGTVGFGSGDRGPISVKGGGKRLCQVTWRKTGAGTPSIITITHRSPTLAPFLIPIRMGMQRSGTVVCEHHIPRSRVT